jgi:hypothetical protein
MGKTPFNVIHVLVNSDYMDIREQHKGYQANSNTNNNTSGKNWCDPDDTK